MSRIDLLINQIIERAQNTAEGFTGYPAEREREQFETHLTKEEFIRSKIKEEASKEKLLAKWYNVRNINHLRLVLFMAIDSRDWPVVGANQFPHPGKAKMYCRIFPAILWPLFLRINRINYLKGLLEPNENPYLFNDENKIASILEPLRGAFENSKHIDKIVTALEKGEAPAIFDAKNISMNNENFYKPFIEIYKQTGMPKKKIAEILCMFIHANNGSGQGIKESAVLANLKRYS